MNLENYYSFYELELSLNLDEKELRQKFLSISKAYHPDYFANDPNKQIEALKISSYNNEAYSILKDLESRIGYYLKLKNLLSDNTSNSLPTNFLMEMMEFNEALADAKMDEDISNLNELKQQIATMKSECINKIQTLASQALNDSAERSIAEQYLQLKYFNNLLLNI
jgi:molecular chaperone HscB